MPKITFLVNNGALNDTRVVKTAEVFAKRGFSCTVIGCDRALHDIHHTERDGVSYQILPLRTAMLADLFAGYAPKLYTAFKNRRSTKATRQAAAANDQHQQQDPAGADPATRVIYSTSAAELELATHKPQQAGPGAEPVQPDAQLPPLKRIAKPILGLARRLYRLLRLATSLPRRYLVQRLQPKTSPMGAKALFGRYLRTFYPQLVSQTTDITYCHELWLLEASVLSKAAGATELLAYDSHELETHRHNDWTDIANATRSAYEAKYIGQMHTVATVCQSIAEHLQQLYNIELPLVVPNAPLYSQARSVAESSKLKQSLALGDNPLLVYTGKVTTGRGLPNILQVLGRMPDAHLAIVGPRVASVANEIATQAKALNLGDRVHFVDAVAPEVLVSAISDADVAVIPIENVCLSYYYSLPNKIYEAALAGVPALASNFPELKRFSDRYGTGVTVDFEDLDAVVEKVRTLLADPTKYNSQAKANQLRQELSFDFALQAVSDRLISTPQI